MPEQQHKALELADALDRLIVEACLSQDGNTAKVSAELRRLRAENEALRKDAKDAALFRWWFSETPKGEFVVTYLEGLRDKWGLDRWRAAIDAAITKGRA